MILNRLAASTPEEARMYCQHVQPVAVTRVSWFDARRRRGTAPHGPQRSLRLDERQAKGRGRQRQPLRDASWPVNGHVWTRKTNSPSEE